MLLIKKSIRLFIIILFVFIGAVVLSIMMNSVYAAQINETDKEFYAEGQAIEIYEMTTEEIEQNPGKTVKVCLLDESEKSYFISDGYIIYAGSESEDVESGNIIMNGGNVKGIIAGGKSGEVSTWSQVIISGGTVDEIKICENAYVSSVSVRIEGDAKVDQLVVGCNKDEYGEFDEATIISESNRRTKISMGYSGGQIVSDAVSNLDKYMMIKINGDTLEGIT